MLKAYCDGSCNNKTKGPGGYGYCIIGPDGKALGRYGTLPKPTTNNRAEMMALLMLLENHPGRKLHIHCDSQYVVKGTTKWMHNWAQGDWEGVKNVDLWKAIYERYDPNLHFLAWVRGHAGVEGNEMADNLAGVGSGLQEMGFVDKWVSLKKCDPIF